MPFIFGCMTLSALLPSPQFPHVQTDTFGAITIKIAWHFECRSHLHTIPIVALVGVHVHYMSYTSYHHAEQPASFAHDESLLLWEGIGQDSSYGLGTDRSPTYDGEHMCGTGDSAPRLKDVSCRKH